MLVPSLSQVRPKASTSQIRPKASTLLACAVALAAVSPATAHAVLAGTAALLFEIVPFAVATAWLERGVERFAHPRPRSGNGAVWSLSAATLSIAGCGCSGGFGGAVSAAALGLAWVGFGPVGAVARFVAAIALGVLAECLGARSCAARRRPLLGSIAGAALAPLHDALPVAACGVLVAQVLATHPGLAAWWPTGLFAGAALGFLLPCTTGGVAIAAALRNSVPAASLGVLLTAGILPRGLRLVRFRVRAEPAPSVAANQIDQRSSESAALMLAAGACALVALRGGAGFVHPRLVPLLAIAACCGLITGFAAFASASGLWRARTSRRSPPSSSRAQVGAAKFAAPSVMFAALVLGSPVPQLHADETTLDGAFAGEHVAFTGTVVQSTAATVLVRYAITCCRADAAPVALRLDRRLPFGDGAWLRATGTLRRGSSGFALHADTLERIAAPADPFVYR